MDLKDGLKFTDKLSPDIQFPVCFRLRSNYETEKYPPGNN